MLTGRRLFKAEHDGALVAMVLAGAEQSPREVVPSVPQALDEVCMTALAMNPDDRYATASDFADALEAAVRKAALRMPSTRELATFVRNFTREVKSAPPQAREDDEISKSLTGSEVPALQSARLPLFPESGDVVPDEAVTRTVSDPGVRGPPSVSAPSHTGTSQLTGIGAVRSQPPPSGKTGRSRPVLIGAMVAIVVVLGVSVTWWSSSVDEPAAAAAGETAVDTAAPVEEQLPPPEETASAEPTDSTAAPQAEPAPVAKPTAMASAATATATATASAVAPKPPGAWKKPPTGRPPKTDSPLGFEPNEL
jgi:serine/threonine-protein kinase